MYCRKKLFLVRFFLSVYETSPWWLVNTKYLEVDAHVSYPTKTAKVHNGKEAKWLAVGKDSTSANYAPILFQLVAILSPTNTFSHV